MRKIKTPSVSGAEIEHDEILDTHTGWNDDPPIIIPNLDSTQKPPSDEFTGWNATFANKYTGWPGVDGAVQGR